MEKLLGQCNCEIAILLYSFVIWKLLEGLIFKFSRFYKNTNNFFKELRHYLVPSPG